MTTPTCQHWADRATKPFHGFADAQGNLNCRTCRDLAHPKLKRVAAAPDRSPCQFLGFETGTMVACEEGCGKGVTLAIFKCAIETTCTIARRGAGVSACCRTCGHYNAQPSTSVDSEAP